MKVASGSGDLFLDFVNIFFTISLLLSFEKGRGHSFDQTWFFFIQGCFLPSLDEIG